MSSEVEQEARSYFKESLSNCDTKKCKIIWGSSHGVPVLVYDKNCPSINLIIASQMNLSFRRKNWERSLMNSKIKGLGRGLSSLIGETKAENKTNNLPLTDIVPNKFQPRKNFEKENLEDLTNSIKERGVIQPIIVRKSNSDNSKYEIIAGERRWLAAKHAGLEDIPVVLTEQMILNL